MEGGDALWTFTVPDNPATGFQDKKVPAIRSMGDVTGDGVADVVFGARNYLTVALDGNGWGGADTLWTFNTCPNNFNCGPVSGAEQSFSNGLAAGFDLNGDGRGDVVLATGGGNDHVYALDGATGAVIWQVGSASDPYLAAYEAVSVRLDVTGDGVPEVAAATGSASDSSPNPYNHRRVYLFDGATGAELWQAAPGIPNFVVAQITDAEGNALVVAGGGAGDEGPSHVTAYDAATGTVAWSITPPFTPFLMEPYPLEGEGDDLVYAGLGGMSGGGAVARVDGATGAEVWRSASIGVTAWDLSVGDLNGDGVPDVAVGSSSNSATVFDGATGEVVWSLYTGAQVFGLAAAGDLTGDGVTDLALALGDGRAVLLDGPTGEEVWSTALGNGTIEQAAEVIVAVPDVDGNGGAELAVGTRHGRVVLLVGTGELLDTASDDPATPAASALEQNYPNPFAGATTIRYRLAEAGPVRLTLYDLLGRRVRVLVDAEQAAGAYEATWDGRDGQGAPTSAGVFIYRLEAGAFSASGRMVRVR